MKRKSILLVLCIGMILTSCESKISLNSTDVKNEKNQKNTTMENPDKGYNLPIDEDKKKEAVNDCEEIMGIIRDIYSEYNGIQEADQNTAEQMMNRMKEIIKQNGNPVIGSDHYSVMDNYQKMEQFLKSAEQEEKGSGADSAPTSRLYRRAGYRRTADVEHGNRFSYPSGKDEQFRLYLCGGRQPRTAPERQGRGKAQAELRENNSPAHSLQSRACGAGVPRFHDKRQFGLSQIKTG